MNFDLEFDEADTTRKLKELLALSDRILPEREGDDFRVWHKSVLNYLKEAFSDNAVSTYFDTESDMQISYSYIGEPDNIYYYDLAKARKSLRLILRELSNKEVKSGSTIPPNQSNRVFVVHGHDEAAREKVERLIEKLGLEPVVLNKQANGGKTIIEKIEAHGGVGFAVVLFTADDLGGSIKHGNPSEHRPRQNVLLELGYFWGKIGRDRVCLLNAIGSSISSDLAGLGYTTLDERGAWRLELVKELKQAGYSVDANAILQL